MLKDRRKFEKEILKRKIAKKDEMFFTYKEGFDVSIIKKDGIEAMFFFGESPKKFITITKHVTDKKEEKINKINSSYNNINIKYKDDIVFLTMATQEKVVEQYLFGLKLLEDF